MRGSTLFTAKLVLPIIWWGPNMNRDLVWQHQGNNGICHPLQNSTVLFYPCTSWLLLWLPVSQIVLSLQRWQRSQQPIIYITLQWRRTGCSLGFLQLPGRIVLLALREEERWPVQFLRLEWTWQSYNVQLGAGGGKRQPPLSSYRANSHDQMCYGKVCLTMHISGESKSAPYAPLGQNSSWLPIRVA